MEYSYEYFCKRIKDLHEQISEPDPDIEEFHIERDTVIWQMLLAVIDGTLTREQAAKLRDDMRPLLKKVVWFA